MVIYPLSSTIQHLNNWGQAPVVEKVDNTIHCMDKSLSSGYILWETIALSTAWINLYPMDSIIGFPNTYPLDGDSSVE